MLQALIHELATAGIRLEANSDKLRVLAPKGSLTDALRRAIGEHKDALLAFLAQPEEAAAPIGRADRTQPLPLSFAQQRLWFLDQLEGPNPGYNIPAALRLTGRLNEEALERSLAAIVERHEALRTRFRDEDGTPAQVVAEESGFRLRRIDLRHAADSDAESRRLAADWAAEPFDLQNDCLLRAGLMQVADGAWLLVLVLHHAAADGWSFGVLIRELEALYTAFHAGLPPPLPALPVQYADFAVWQRQQQARIDQQIGYWRTQLAGLPPLLELPGDFPRPAVPSYRGARVDFQFSADLTARMKSLAQAQGATLFMVLLAGFALLVSRLSRQADCAIGTPIANRTRPELEGLIGFFANTLVLRVEVDGQARFADLLRQVRETTLNAYQHQDVPFEQLVDALKPARSLAHSPLFQVMLALQNAPLGGMTLPELALSPVQPETGHAKFDLNVSVHEFPDPRQGMGGAAEYATDLFRRETVERWIDLWRRLLDAAVRAPEQPLGALSWLPPDDPAYRFGRGPERLAPLRPLADWFTRSAAAYPEHIALRCGDGAITYRELDRRSNRLARHLLELGAGEDRPVGLAVERGLDLGVALLAILKTGSPYLPLDPVYPLERRRFMLEDAAVKLVVGDGSAKDLLDACPALDIRSVRLGPALAAQLESRPDTPLALDIPAANLAYVIYTSGSTGQPKGVALPQAAVSNLIAWQEEAMPLAAGTPVLQFASINFDVSCQEFFTTWAAGGEVVIADEAVRRDPPAILALIEARRIERLFLPVVMLQHLAEAALEFGVPACVRDIVTAGEALRITPEIRAWFARAPQARLHNHYGPSESHVVTACTLHPPADAWPLSPSIGVPIANCEIGILDAAGAPCPVGVPGELCIAGVCLARGYLNRPELTAEKFVLAPKALRGRWYKTGDLARWHADGSLELIGRIDQQIKLRGFRIELGEIEAQLLNLAEVREAAVVVRSAGQEKQLVAYLAPQADGLDAAGEAAWLDAVRTRLAAVLPAYMVPARFVALAQLPQTRSGKVDRLSLPEVAAETIPADGEAPRSLLEQQLGAIFCAVLQRETVPRDASFFDLGGHSLTATQLAARIRHHLQRDVPIKALFSAPTVAGLARWMETHAAASDLPPLRRLRADEARPLSFGQQRMWFLARLEGPSASYNMPAALRLVGKVDADTVARAFERIVERHEILRTGIVDVDGEPVLRVAPPECFRLDVRESTEGPAQALVQAEAERPFDLACPPLIRVCLIRVAPEEHVLAVTVHHIVGDGWSIGLVVNEFIRFYRGADVPPLAIQYSDYAAWQREVLSSRQAAAQDFWRQTLRDAPPLLALPTDHPRPAVQRFVGRTAPVSLPPTVAEGLRTLARRHDATLFMAVMAWFQSWLAQISGQTDLPVGSADANRPLPELESLVGYFANLWVLRGRLGHNPSFHQLLEETREAALAAQPHLGLPFDLVVDAVAPTRSPAYTPVFQVMCLLHNTPRAVLDFPDLHVEGLSYESRIAKHDLTLNLWEVDGGLSGSLEYSTDLFRPETIADWVERLERLAAQLVEHPDLPVLDHAIGETETRPPGPAALAIEACLRRHPACLDCVVLDEPTDAPVAWVVHRAPVPAEAHFAALRNAGLPLPRAIVAVDRIPLRADGTTDFATLRALPVFADPGEIETQCAAELGVSAVALAQREAAPAPRRLHLADVLPGWRFSAADSPIDPALKDGGNNGPSEPGDRPSALAVAVGEPLIVPPDAPKTLVEALLRTAERFPDKGLCFYSAERTLERLTYPQLVARARRLLAGLRQRGLARGDAVILQIKHLPDYFPAFWACVLGGIVPVTVAVPPTYDGSHPVLKKLWHIWDLLAHPPILTQDDLVADVAGLERVMSMAALEVIPLSAATGDGPHEEILLPEPQDVVFYQLSSGSTGASKCIQETHRGIVSHVLSGAQACGYGPDDVTVNWLPMDHVVPILTCHLRDVYLGCEQIEIPTEAVLSEPSLWLDALERFGATLTWSPNFGFKLLADALSRNPERRWDLSRIRWFMNAGEQVTLPVLEQFAAQMDRCGVLPARIQPAFGMAEVCTCMTYCNDFDFQRSVRWFQKASLGARLQPATPGQRDAIEFVDLGGPSPGVEIRITDADNRPVPEGVIGRFQIRGQMVTPGYLRNDDANAEAFVGDGWFNSGDLGFILDGRLTLTGREKEMIIVHGANFYCYEIEDEVNAVPGVEPTFSAAVGLADRTAGTEALAIFFVPRPDAPVTPLVQNIREQVTQKLGVSPAYVVPLKREDFPKTTSGKIQRTQLKNGLIQGRFDAVLKQIDLSLGTANTLPDWFHRRVWRKQVAVHHMAERASMAAGTRGPRLVFGDGEGVGAALAELGSGRLIRSAQDLPRDRAGVGPGAEPTEDFRPLFRSFQGCETTIDLIVLWPLDEPACAPGSGAERIERVVRSVGRLKTLLLHWREADPEGRLTCRLVLATRQAQALSERESMMAEAAALPTWFRAAAQENPWLRATTLDLAGGAPAERARALVEELAEPPGETAWRRGQRYVPRLEAAPLGYHSGTAEPLPRGGTYLLTGGLGGIGTALAGWLIRRHQARVILLGRTEEAQLAPSSRDALAGLQRMAGDAERVGYHALDCSDTPTLARWMDAGIPAGSLDGIFHLAGTYAERPALDLAADDVRAALHAKLGGALALREVLKQHSPHAFLAFFSSLLGIFPAGGTAAYSMANACVSALPQERSGVREMALDFSNWEHTGMSAALGGQDSVAARGFCFVPAVAGLQSLEIALAQGEGRLLVGLNEAAPPVRRLLLAPPRLPGEWTVFAEAENIRLPSHVLCLDALRQPTRLPVVALSALPRHADGAIDRDALGRLGRPALTAPSTPTEKSLAEIWRETLGQAPAGVEQRFFEAGGNSLLAVAFVSRVQRRFGRELPLATLFAHPTIQELGHWLDGGNAETDGKRWSHLVPLRPQAGPNLFLIHPGGGNVLCYRDLAAHLGRRAVYGVQASGLLSGQPIYTELPQLARAYAEAIRQHQPDGPYTVAGWSFGGFAAVAVAAELQAAGAAAYPLIIDINLAFTDEDLEAIDRFDEIDLLIEAMPELQAQRAAIRALPREEQLGEVLKRMQALGLAPKEMTLADARRFVEVSNAFIAMRRRGLPEDLRLTTRVDLIVSAESQRRWPEHPMLGWERHCTDLRVHRIDGDHQKLVLPPLAGNLGGMIEKILDGRDRRTMESAPALNIALG